MGKIKAEWLTKSIQVRSLNKGSRNVGCKRHW